MFSHKPLNMMLSFGKMRKKS